MTDVLRYSAFAATPDGGNPAGIVLDATALSDADMLGIATEVGYAETAFVVSRPEGTNPVQVGLRFFSPTAEVPFCGHATVATAVVLSERLGEGTYLVSTAAGQISLDARRVDGVMQVTFTSVEPQARDLDGDALRDLLSLLGLTGTDLHRAYPPLEVFAGNWHPVITLHDRDIFHQFRFDPVRAAALKDRNGWTGTITVLLPMTPVEFEARNIFPTGRLTEDPATGSAAASTGAYLREINAFTLPAEILIHQGRHVGRPSLLRVGLGESGGIRVTGTAIPIR